MLVPHQHVEQHGEELVDHSDEGEGGSTHLVIYSDDDDDGDDEW